MYVSRRPNPIQTNSVNHSQKPESSGNTKGIFSGRTVKNLSSKMAAPFKAMKSAAKSSIEIAKGYIGLAKTLYDSSKPDPYWDNL